MVSDEKVSSAQPPQNPVVLVQMQIVILSLMGYRLCVQQCFSALEVPLALQDPMITVDLVRN
jgi:hypothetical protein